MSERTRDPLDQAIDRVAARFVSVDQDEEMVERIVTRLPERSRVSGWLHVLVPQAAIAAVLIVGALVWMTSNRERVTVDPVAAPPLAAVSAGEVPAVHAAVPAEVPHVAARRVTPAALPADHEFSLAPVEAPTPLEIVPLNSPLLPEEAFVVLAPIVLTELPLSGESISPG